MSGLSLLLGTIVGFSLGLTGGGGAIFAVPLLVYGLSVSPKEAVIISLATVASTALVGAIQRLYARLVEVRTGLIFSLGGMSGAPIGAWVSGLLPDAWLLLSFSALMLLVSIRMWRKTNQSSPKKETNTEENERLKDHGKSTYFLISVGFLTGILSGLFGIGGGFMIVPALVIFRHLSIHRAIATSLFVVTLVSASSLISHLIHGRSFSLETTAFFTCGSILGMVLGSLLGKRISGPNLQKVFSLAIIAVALFVVVKTLNGI